MICNHDHNWKSNKTGPINKIAVSSKIVFDCHDKISTVCVRYNRAWEAEVDLSFDEQKLVWLVFQINQISIMRKFATSRMPSSISESENMEKPEQRRARKLSKSSSFGFSTKNLCLEMDQLNFDIIPSPNINIRIKHCQRHNGPEGWVLVTKVMYLGHITNYHTNLEQTTSESRPSTNYKISTKHQQNFNLKILTKPSFRISTKI